MHHKLPVVFIFIFIHTAATAQLSETDSAKRFSSEFSYTGDIVTNLSGGMKTGTSYLGMVSLKLSTRLWKGGEFFINASNTHGAEPSAQFLGDYQIASNIEAGNHTYLQELWIRHLWKHGVITVGLQDLNVDLVNTSYGALYLNSSFGILPTVSGNIPAPIFPLTSLGLCAHWKLTKKLTLHTAAYDGAPTDFEENPHNLKWHLSSGDGFLFFTELQHETSIGNLPGMIKAGLYLHQHLTGDSDHSRDRDSLYRNNNGIYLLGEQQVWQGIQGNRNLGLFLQLGYTPKNINSNYYYIGTGLNFTGLFNRNGNDIAGLAVAHCGMRGDKKSETSIELTYRFHVFGFLYLQPDFQYIINPAGTGENLDNCMAATVRFGVTY